MSSLQLSHVASPRECDVRQIRIPDATPAATKDATTVPSGPSVRALARDRLLRHESDKAPLSVATQLRRAIDRCCNARGDDDVNRAALISESSALPVDGQRDMQQHFDQEAERWERALKPPGVPR